MDAIDTNTYEYKQVVGHLNHRRIKKLISKGWEVIDLGQPLMLAGTTGKLTRMTLRRLK